MKDIKKYLIDEHKSTFNEDQNWKYWAKSIISKLTLAFESKGKDPEEKIVDGWDEEIIKLANKEDLYDSIWCLYRCWNAGDYKYQDIDKLCK